MIAVALGRLATESLRKYPAELWRRAAQSVPLQRLGEVEEYGWLVALLATPLGRALSGSVVTLDGGLDNWTGPWPPEELTSDGEVPTEERAVHPVSACGSGAATRRRRAGSPPCRAVPCPIPAGEVSTVARKPSKL